MYCEHLTDEEFVRKLYASELTHVENALLFRLTRALDKHVVTNEVGQFGAQPSTPFPEAFDGKS